MEVHAVDRIIDILIELEIKHFFGIPGGFMMNFFEAVHDKQDKIMPIVPRNEWAASCMAEMYGKLTRKPGVFVAQGAFAGSIGLFGILEAFLASTPMLVLTEMSDFGPFGVYSPMQSGTGDFGSFDIKGIFKNNSKYLFVANYPREAILGVQTAIKHAVCRKQGPSCASLEATQSVEDSRKKAYLQFVKPDHSSHLQIPARQRRRLKEQLTYLSKQNGPLSFRAMVSG